MGILSRSRIASLVTEDIEGFRNSLEGGQEVTNILISPFQHRNLGPTSYELTIGNKYASLKGKITLKTLSEGEVLRIKPGESVTLVSREYIGLPVNISATVFGKVSWLEKGLSQISTYIHPGFYGHLIETITNMTDKTVELSFGSPFCQMVFMEVPDATKEERYMGDRRGQTAEDLKRLTGEHNPNFLHESLVVTGVIQKRGDWYIGYVEEIAGVNTQGVTIDEVRENLKEALELVIEANREISAASQKDAEVSEIQREPIAVQT